MWLAWVYEFLDGHNLARFMSSQQKVWNIWRKKKKALCVQLYSPSVAMLWRFLPLGDAVGSGTSRLHCTCRLGCREWISPSWTFRNTLEGRQTHHHWQITGFFCPVSGDGVHFLFVLLCRLSGSGTMNMVTMSTPGHEVVGISASSVRDLKVTWEELEYPLTGIMMAANKSCSQLFSQ